MQPDSRKRARGARIVAARPWMAGRIAQLQGRNLPEAPWNTQEICDFMAESTSLALAALGGGDGVDGFALCRLIGEDAEILSIVVADSRRRSRIGTRLLARSFRATRRLGGKRVFLEVSPCNEPALALYRKLGFVAVGVRKDYYRRRNGNVEDALTLLKVLVPRGRGRSNP